jgi:hypothetical protein
MSQNDAMKLKREMFRVLTERVAAQTIGIDENEMLKDFKAWRNQRLNSRPSEN